MRSLKTSGVVFLKRVLHVRQEILKVVSFIRISLDSLLPHLEWTIEASFRPEEAFLLYVVMLQKKEYTLTIETAPARTFPLPSYEDEDGDYVLRFFLECTQDMTFTYNRVTFHKRKPKIFEYVDEAKNWAEEYLLSPMERLNYGLK